MLKLDHLTILAPTLDAGVAHVRNRLGLEMGPGGKHPQMGTHNRLLRLGDAVYLEVIAIDPEAAAPGRPRWFGLDDRAAIEGAWNEGRRLGGWVAQTDGLDGLLARHGAMLGEKLRVSRGERTWLFAVPGDGSRPAGGLAPSVIDWEGRDGPAGSMPDQNARLLSFTVEHPDPDGVRALYRDLEVIDPPMVEAGPALRYRAAVETPAGLRTLD